MTSNRHTPRTRWNATARDARAKRIRRIKMARKSQRRNRG
jgi:hypothetical protein